MRATLNALLILILGANLAGCGGHRPTHYVQATAGVSSGTGATTSATPGASPSPSASPTPGTAPVPSSAATAPPPTDLRVTALGPPPTRWP